MHAAVVIPTLNAGPRLEAVLDGCLAQCHDGSVEVVAIDSGSTDGTVGRLHRRGVAVHEIPNREFGHGRTRNLALTLTDAEVLAFLTQDARPVGNRWLTHLLAPFALGDHVAATCARQQPEPACRPTVKRDVVRLFRSLGPDTGVVVQTGPAPFFSNVSSAVRRSALEATPFRDVPYAEDRALALDLVAAGRAVAYAPDAVVEHSHDLALWPYLKRMIDEFRALEALGLLDRPGVVRHMGAFLVGTAGDVAWSLRDPAYGALTRLRFAAGAPGYNVARRAAIALAARGLPHRLGDRLSLEAEQRRAAAPTAPPAPRDIG